MNDQFAKTQARAIAAAQLEADQLMDELRPFYAARYAKYGGKAKHKPGDRVPIAVLGRQDFEASRTVLDAELLAEEHALITKYIPHAASKVISGHGRMASVTLIPVTAATILTPLQLELIKPRKGKSTRGLAGFYSVARDTIFVRVDQVEAGTIAHELGHAYASSLWGEFSVAMVLQTEQVNARGRGSETLSAVFFDVDEGATSKLAQAVLDDWYAASTKPGMHSRPAAPPSALVGYMTTTLTTAENFIRSIDGDLFGTPKANTFRTYFGGDLSFTIDEAEPLESDVRCGGAKSKKLRDLL